MYGTRILLIGEDHDELLRRAEVVSAVGHEVEVAIGRHRGILACGARLFDYIVITASCDEDAAALARDVATVSPASEVVNVNQWQAAGLEPEHEPGFLLSLLTAAVQPTSAVPSMVETPTPSPMRTAKRRAAG